MKLQYSHDLPLPKESAFETLIDPLNLQNLLPGCESFEKSSDATFEASATNQIGPMNATFSGKINLRSVFKLRFFIKNLLKTPPPVSKQLDTFKSFNVLSI